MRFFNDANMATNMAHLGGVINKAGQFVAKVETKDSDTRFKMEGPARDDEQQAARDLSFIRAAADGELSRSGGLKAMQLEAKRLRDASKAIPSGSIEEADGRFIAMIDTNHSGPLRDDKQQAAQDLSAIRAAALTGGAPIPGPSPFKPNGLEINPDPFQPNGLEIKGSCDRSNK